MHEVTCQVIILPGGDVKPLMARVWVVVGQQAHLARDHVEWGCECLWYDQVMLWMCVCRVSCVCWWCDQVGLRMLVVC